MRISDWSSDVCSSDLHADPREMGAEVEPPPLPRPPPGLRFLVGQQQRLVRGVEVDPVEVVHLAAGQRLPEAARVADAGAPPLVFLRPSPVPHPAPVPALGVVPAAIERTYCRARGRQYGSHYVGSRE